MITSVLALTVSFTAFAQQQDYLTFVDVSKLTTPEAVTKSLGEPQHKSETEDQKIWRYRTDDFRLSVYFKNEQVEFFDYSEKIEKEEFAEGYLLDDFSLKKGISTDAILKALGKPIDVRSKEGEEIWHYASQEEQLKLMIDKKTNTVIEYQVQSR